MKVLARKSEKFQKGFIFSVEEKKLEYILTFVSRKIGKIHYRWRPFGMFAQGYNFFAACFAQFKNSVFIFLNEDTAAFSIVIFVEFAHCFEGCTAACTEIHDDCIGRLAGNFD